MAKGYEQVAMTKMVFPTEHFISIRQCCCKISGLEIMPAVSTGVAHAAAASEFLVKDYCHGCNKSHEYLQPVVTIITVFLFVLP